MFILSDNLFIEEFLVFAILPTLSLFLAFFGRKERLFDPRLGGGSLLDLGVYPVTYAYAIFGNPKSIEAKAKMKNGVK